MDESIVKTEIKLSEESIQKILTAEVATIILGNPEIINEIVRNVLFTRPERKSSYGDKPPTFFESAVKKTFEPMLQEIIAAELQKKKPALKKIIAGALKTSIIEHGEFAQRLIDSMSKFTSSIGFYLKSD